ncbi:hypothetical protein ACKUSY_13860 [Myroides odoratus]
MSRKKIHAVNSTYFWFVFFPLFLGALIYVVARDRSIYFLQFLSLNFSKVELPYWIQYHLPDGLWAFAFSSLVAIIWQDVRSKAYYAWLTVLLLVVVGLEVFYGTFDWYDLLFMLLGIGLAFGIFRVRNKN